MNKDNLKKLADYLFSLPEDYKAFEMAVFFTIEVDEESEADRARVEAIEIKYALENGGVHNCGAVACAVGHGPSAGMLVHESEIRYGEVMWDSYSRRIFGIANSSDEWQWMFGGQWSQVDNTPRGAAKRIMWLVDDKEVPEAFQPSRWSFSETRDILVQMKELYNAQ